MEQLITYFPELTQGQRARFAAMGDLYREWNARINVVSRQDIDRLEERHILHSLAIAKADLIKPGEQVLDVGTGGGFPGIPLAIYYPDTQFTLVDSIGKKIRVVEAVSRELELRNVRAVHARVEQLDGGATRFDWVVSRAVTELKTLLDWTWGRALRGLIGLKGGDLAREIAATDLLLRSQSKMSPPVIPSVVEGPHPAVAKAENSSGEGPLPIQQLPLSTWFPTEFFQTKHLLILQKQ